MASALIGYTGFVGSNLAAQHTFDDQYNTSNINDIEGKSYDLVVSAATYAEMWRINQNPEGDLAQINGLIEHLKRIKTKKFVLISTTGVYKNRNAGDEDMPIETHGLEPYGVNRFHLEQFVQGNFDSLIVRLPGLFGNGLKKNVIFDLLHHNNVEKLHYAGTYQYYNLAHIWEDIKIALEHNLKLVNFATEPIRTDEVASYAFNIADFKNQPEGVKPVNCDIHSKHAELYGGKVHYLYNKQQELKDIKKFVVEQKALQKS